MPRTPLRAYPRPATRSLKFYNRRSVAGQAHCGCFGRLRAAACSTETLARRGLRLARTREPHSEEDCDGKRSATRKPRSQEAEKGKAQGRGDRPGAIRAQPLEIDGGEGRSKQEEIARRNATWLTCDRRETVRVGPDSAVLGIPTARQLAVGSPGVAPATRYNDLRGKWRVMCGPLELSKAVVSAALLLRLLRGSDELTIHPTKNYPGCNGRRDARHSRIRRSCPCYRWLRTV